MNKLLFFAIFTLNSYLVIWTIHRFLTIYQQYINYIDFLLCLEIFLSLFLSHFLFLFPFSISSVFYVSLLFRLPLPDIQNFSLLGARIASMFASLRKEWRGVYMFASLRKVIYIKYFILYIIEVNSL